MSEDNATVNGDGLTDEELIHAVERKLGRVEQRAAEVGDTELVEMIASLHRRLARCLVRHNTVYATTPVVLRSGGGK